MQTGSHVTGERFFNITQKGKFSTNDFKREILPEHYFPTIQNEISYISIGRMRVYASGFW